MRFLSSQIILCISTSLQQRERLAHSAQDLFSYGSQEIAGGCLRLQGQRKDYKQAYGDLVCEWQRADHTHQTRSSSMVESMQMLSTLSFCLDYHCSFLRLQFPGKWELSHAILNIRRPGRKKLEQLSAG